MRVLSALVLAVAYASTASAQSPYVGVSFIADVVRLSGSTDGDGSGNGETLGGALRAGVSLGQQWGVELEFARTGTIEETPDVFRAQGSLTFFPSDGSVISPDFFPIPEFRSERQLSTISTMVWWNHEVSERVGLAYLGGVAFTRTTHEFRIGYRDFPVPLGPMPSLIFPPRLIERETVSYGADVAVGFEGRIGMTEHLRLTPGIRLQTISAGWAIRPGVGLQWMF
jgi:hypothetical protein